MLIGLPQRGPCLVLGSKRAEPSAPGLPPCPHPLPCPHPAPCGQGGGGGGSCCTTGWMTDSGAGAQQAVVGTLAGYRPPHLQGPALGTKLGTRREKGAVCCSVPPSSGGQALQRVPHNRSQRRGFSWQPGAGCPARRDTLGCGHRTAWISTLTRPSATVLWLAGHAEQTRFTQPALWWALLPGIWDICRKSGTVCGIPQLPQLASCCR